MAYIMGKVRDRSDIREILTGKDYYVPELGSLTCDTNIEDPYDCAERHRIDLSTRLVRSVRPARAIFSARKYVDAALKARFLGWPGCESQSGRNRQCSLPTGMPRLPRDLRRNARRFRVF
jgi:hypothetical protein